MFLACRMLEPGSSPCTSSTASPTMRRRARGRKDSARGRGQAPEGEGRRRRGDDREDVQAHRAREQEPRAGGGSSRSSWACPCSRRRARRSVRGAVQAGLVYAAASEDTLCFSCEARATSAPAAGQALLGFVRQVPRAPRHDLGPVHRVHHVRVRLLRQHQGHRAVKALQLIKKHGSIEEMLKSSRREVPGARGLAFKEARDSRTRGRQHRRPGTQVDSRTRASSRSGRGEAVQRGYVRNTLKKQTARGASQNRLETFFGAATVKSSTTGKRKEAEKEGEERIRGGRSQRA